MARMVQCVKLGRELPGLAKPPMPGPLGQKIYDEISEKAWNGWEEHRTLLINHYNLNMGDPEARRVLREEMEAYLFGDPQHMPEGWVPEGAGAAAAPSGKGGGGGAPSRKGGGGGAPQRK